MLSTYLVIATIQGDAVEAAHTYPVFLQPSVKTYLTNFFSIGRNTTGWFSPMLVECYPYMIGAETELSGVGKYGRM